jgi:hypothetical protein
MATGKRRKKQSTSEKSMSMKTVGQVGAALGAILLLLSLAANPLGIGSNPREFGWLQMLGSVLGCLAVAGGLWLAQRNK